MRRISERIMEKLLYKGGSNKRMEKKMKERNSRGITLIALVITTIFSYDENSKFSNNKGFLLKAI